MLSEENASAHIRGRQLSAIDNLLPPMMIGNVVCAAGVTFLFFAEHGTLLPCWFGVVAGLSFWRLAMVLRSNKRPQRPASRRAIRRRTLQAAIMAAAFTSVPALLLNETSGLSYAIMVCLLTGMLWAGSLVLATVVPAALAYISVATAFIITGFLTAGLNAEHVGLALLFLAQAVTAVRSVRQQSRLFVASQRQQFDLKQQGEVIGVLLKDYEEQTSDWLWETDADLRYRNPSSRFLQAAARDAEAVAGAVFGSILADPSVPGNNEAMAALRDHARAHRPFRDLVIPFARMGEPRWWSVSGRPIRGEDGTFLGYRGVTSDVTATKIAEARIVHLAHHDALTGLPNRAFFSDSLDQALQGLGEGMLAVLSLDLDGFKAVNDRHGHPVGDVFLVAVAERLRTAVRSGDVVARFGGDEFMVLDPTIRETSEVETLCEHLIRRLSEPFDVAGQELTVGVSIGVALAPLDGSTSKELLKNSDSALYRAKNDGRGTFRFFAPEMDHRLQEHRQVVQDLRMALARSELVLHYQPFVSAETGVVSGYEALIRWVHPKRGLVSPCEFIPLAEESGLIVPIGAWVIERACRDAAAWPTEHRVSVNISPVQFRDRQLPQIVLAALTAAGLSPSRLELEVTEAVLIDDASATLDTLRHIRAMGVRVALDDFGTGYSSLSYLRRFPFDRIKIDRSFVKELDVRQDSQVIVQAIRDMASGLGMSITAEGVETEEQAERLRLTGCEELQGFLFSRPKSAREIDDRSPAPDHAAEPRTGAQRS